MAALVLAVLATLVGPVTEVAAAVAPKDGGQASAPASGPAAVPEPSAAPAPQAPAAGAGKQRPEPAAERAAAGREISRIKAADSCSGAIAPDTVHTCADVPAGGARYTLALTKAPDLVVIQSVSATGGMTPKKLTAPDGSTVTCTESQPGYGTARCLTSGAGTYTLDVSSPFGGGFSVAYRALLSSSTCTAVAASETTLGTPKTFAADLAAGSAGDCYRLPMATGAVLRTHLTSYEVQGSLFDATGRQVCAAESANSQDFDCELTGAAPYTLLVHQDYGRSAAYGFTVARLSQPGNCPLVKVQAYGSVPDARSPARCRILRVATAGPHVFGPTQTSSWISGTLYRANGTAACPPVQNEPCALAAGDYTWVRDANNTTTDAYGIWFHATNQSAGCTAARDDGFASGPAKGTFTGAGQRLCRTLPTATGKGVYLYDTPPTDGGADPVTTVYDAKGVQQCSATANFSVCRLTGAAPFRAVLSGPSTGAYRLTVHDTGRTTGCTAWNSTGFGPSAGHKVDLTAAKQVACLTLGADKHSTAEMIDYTNATNRVNATVMIYDGSGNTVCSTAGGSTTACGFKAGPAYTAVLVGTGRTDSYRLVRRDISQTAACAAPASLTAGGASTGYTFTSALDSTCVKVKAAATDKLVFSVRTPEAAYRTGAQLTVADATGKVVCRQWGSACRVTGSDGYVVYVLASGHDGSTPIVAHIDTWKVATAAGWAPECTGNRIGAEDFPVRSGTLTEAAAGYCAVATVKPGQRFTVHGADDSTLAQSNPRVNLLSSTGFTGSALDPLVQCDNNNLGDFTFSCMLSSFAPEGEYLFLLDAYTTATPVTYSMQGICTSRCTVWPKSGDVDSVTPATSSADTTTTVVLHGTDLHLGTALRLVAHGSDASSYRMFEPVMVNAAGTELTVRLSTFSVAPGTYDLVVGSAGYTGGVRTPGYLPGAYTVTAAPPAPEPAPNGHPLKD
ncbi:hypothetical protein AB0D54_30660 [Streptomyces xanthophaeus]|uniref:hypothetical protein n=1 Tax=Streptomyces xanthophaeus TaxID=67385 RepID=UPI00341A671E